MERRRAQGLHPLKSLLDRGLVVAGGSDAPIEVPNPLIGIYAAVTRCNVGEKHDGYNPKEKISRFEAVHLYTGERLKSLDSSTVVVKLQKAIQPILRF